MLKDAINRLESLVVATDVSMWSGNQIAVQRDQSIVDFGHCDQRATYLQGWCIDGNQRSRVNTGHQSYIAAPGAINEENVVRDGHSPRQHVDQFIRLNSDQRWHQPYQGPPMSYGPSGSYTMRDYVQVCVCVCVCVCARVCVRACVRAFNTLF